MQSQSQLQRLKKDSKELEHYIRRLNKRGKTDKAHKLAIKADYLNQTIAELQTLH